MPSDRVFKTQISRFAPWVHKEFHAYINHIYCGYITRYKKSIKNRTEDKYLSFAANAFEFLAQDEVFKEVWEKSPYNATVMEMSGVFLTYEHLTPKIKLSERNDYLKDCLKSLKKITDLIDIDPSVYTCFNVAYNETLFSNLKPMGRHFENEKNPDGSIKNDAFILGGISLNSYDFLIKLQEEIELQSMRTHISVPKKMSNKETVERHYFSLKISAYLISRLRRIDHVKCAEILNIIRPDLGKFTPNGISKVVNASTLKEDYKSLLR